MCRVFNPKHLGAGLDFDLMWVSWPAYGLLVVSVSDTSRTPIWPIVWGHKRERFPQRDHSPKEKKKKKQCKKIKEGIFSPEGCETDPNCLVHHLTPSQTQVGVDPRTQCFMSTNQSPTTKMLSRALLHFPWCFPWYHNPWDHHRALLTCG